MTDCNTFHGRDECCFLWKIENFSVSRLQNRSYIKSAVFVSKILKDTAWRFILSLSGEHMAINLERTNRALNQYSPEIVYFDIGLVNMLGAMNHKQSNTLNLVTCTKITLSKFVERSAVYGEDSYLLQNDVLTVKGRLWNRSSRSAFPEKVLLRSTLRMEMVGVEFTINPQVHLQSFDITSESVPEGFKLTCIRSDTVPMGLLNIAPPVVTIVPLRENKIWACMTARIVLKGRPREPSCRLEGFCDFGIELIRPWLLPPFKGDFDQNQYLNSESMYLDCEFTISNLDKEAVWETWYTDMHNNNLVANALPRSALVDVLRPVLRDPMFTDVQVQVGEARIPAHRVVLSARSRVFRQLFIADADRRRGRKGIRSLFRRFSRLSILHSAESPLDAAVRKSCVSVSRTDGHLCLVFSHIPECFVRKIVLFLYTDDVGCVDHHAVVQLLYAAGRYHIRDLWDWCESFLQLDITMKNACRTLQAAELMKCNNLKKKTLLFINRNINGILLYLDSLSLNHVDRKFAKNFGLVRGENRNTELFPNKAE